MMVLYIDYGDKDVEYIAVKYVRKQEDEIVYEQIGSQVSRTIVMLERIKRIALQTEEGVLIQDLYVK